ncbi:MAG: CBS domain-containing protein [Halobacteriovoraceae bacterium]|nr:CBS domain-containing protein [Halobacteriovoraceae bacterium]
MEEEAIVRDEIDISKFEKKLSDLNLNKPIAIAPDDKLLDVLAIMQKNRIGSLMVTEGDKLVGILSERDLLLRVVGVVDNWRESTAGEVMTVNPMGLRSDERVLSCLKIMAKKEFRHLPVLDEQGKLSHVLSINDILHFVVDLFPNLVEKFGTKVDWDVHAVEIYGENFSFGQDVENKHRMDSSIFLSPLSKAINPNKKMLKMDVSSSCQEVLQQMRESKRGVVILTKFETEISGIITERDFLFKIFGKFNLKTDQLAAKDFMTPNPHTLLTKHIFAYAINNMFTFRYRNIIIVNEDEFPIALISLLDIFKYLSFYLFPEDYQVE